MAHSFSSVEIETSIQAAERWIKSKSVEGRWRIPVISECVGSTALSLLVTEGRKLERAIQYLLAKKVWEQSVAATSNLVWALLSQNDKALAVEVAKKCAKARNVTDLSVGDDKLLNYILKRGYPRSNPSIRKHIAKKLIKTLVQVIPPLFWTSRSSHLYDFIPHVSYMFLKDRQERGKILELLVHAQNPDGSFGGHTVPTIKLAYMLRELGEEIRYKKALKWLENVFNENGSLRPIFCQDVYDTAWTAIVLSDTCCVDKSINWLEGTKVEGFGYPYYSDGYYPDCDDSSLVLLAKKEAGYSFDEETVNFLLTSQNPDGGWSYVPFYSLKHTLPYRHLASRIEIVRDTLKKWGTSLFWHPIFDSTVDMTSRVLITLAHYPQSSEKKRKAISKGVSYLMRRYEAGRFHQHRSWMNSSVCETSMALIALSLNNAQFKVKGDVLNWLLTQHNLGGDELAHVIWASSTVNAPAHFLIPAVKRLVSIQENEGFWLPTTAFKSTSWYFDPIFSTALPLLALKKSIEL